MKTATLPVVRVSPELRQRAETQLRPGETLSTYIEHIVDMHTRWREEDDAFYARGLAAAKRIDEGGKTYTLDEVMVSLRESSAKKQRELTSQSKSTRKTA